LYLADNQLKYGIGSCQWQAAYIFIQKV
jgi:hypothetical protein